MAMRLERDGNLIYVRGAPDPPKQPERRKRGLGLWVVLVLLVIGVVFASLLAPAWPAILHSVRGFLASLR